jgi:hypothetical protein
MKALSLAQIAPNEICARRIGLLPAIGRLSQNDETAHKRRGLKSARPGIEPGTFGSRVAAVAAVLAL